MVYKNWESLESAIKDKVKLAILDAGTKANQELRSNIDRFYSYQNPKPQYVRTDNLRNSQDYEYTENVDTAIVQIMMDTTTPYETGTYTTQKVFDEAEVHGSKIAGIPYFWRDTMDKIEYDILPSSMGSQGFI